MLNIPDEVKALFKADSVFKNFHVHFPNGENADLNNDDVVSESVEFTESICSQQSFRFGLTEASELKFTAVNIPNVRGATLEAALEIDIETLGSEWAEQHAPSGTESFLDPQVCTYGSRTMYRVPYGRFIVDTCPRNHEAMWKREVTAYTERMDDAETVNPFQVALMNSFYPGVDTYTPYAKPLALSFLTKTEAEILSAGYRKVTTGIGSQYSGFFNSSKTLTKKDGTTIRISCAFFHRGTPVPNGYNASTALYTIDWRNFWDTDPIALLADALENLSINLDAEASGYSSFYDMAADYLQNYYLPGVLEIFNESTGIFAYVNIPKGSTVLYPFVSDMESNTQMAPAYLDEIQIYDASGQTGVLLDTVEGLPYVRFNVYVSGNDPMNVALNISSTLQTERKTYRGNVVKMYSFANAVSLPGIAQGYLELRCRFGSPARTGGMEVTALDNTTSTAVLPSDYASLWYDETTISPIGYVALKFKDETGEEQDLTVQIGTGASVYDLSDNEVLKNMAFTVSKSEAEAGTTIESKLLAFLNSAFTPNIPDLSFVPIELEKKGLPYFEAGDAVTITTGDGQTVPSFILRQTIKGIQFLTASVESANGEAVEMVES